MRSIEYISPTSLQQFYDDRQEFYLQRLADNRPPKFLQTKPMSVGSAFDAYLKSYLAGALGINDERFKFESIFTAQVEAHNRDWALVAGKWCFDEYKRLGALANLMHELKLAKHTPRMEFEVRGHVRGIPILGKPDLYFVVSDGSPVMLDFKVNGYCSNTPASPCKGYVLCLGSWGRGNGSAHPDAHVSKTEHGVTVNLCHKMEEVNEDWARQLCIYLWTLGEDVGTQAVMGIEQLCCKKGSTDVSIRVASHRCICSKEHQEQVASQIVKMWAIIQSGHIFDDVSRAESDEKCKMLDEYHKQDETFRMLTRES